MTTLSEQVAALEKELAEAKEKLAREKEKKSVTVGFEEPPHGYRYWYVDGFGEVCSSVWTGGADSDDKRLTIGNVFLTEEAAMKKLRQRKTLAELHKMTNGFVPDRHGWYEIATNESGGFDVEFFRGTYYSGDIPRYRTIEDARSAIDAVGMDRIKELMMGV